MKIFPTAIFWYGIHSTSVLRSIHDFTYSSGTNISLLRELHLVYSAVIKNRIVYHDTFPYLVRQEFTSQGARSRYETEALDRIFLNRTWSDDLHSLICKLHEDLLSSGILIASDEFERLFNKNFRVFLLRWNRFAYLSNLARDSRALQKAKYLYKRWRYVRIHHHVRRYRDDKELAKVNDFLLPK